MYRPFIGKCDDITIETITDHGTSNNSGARIFTDQPILLHHNILWRGGDYSSWTRGAVSGEQLLKLASIGVDDWKYPIGEYYNKSGVLTGNDTTTDLAQTPVYIGGIPSSDERTFIPSEYSLTLRDTSKAYKLIGYFSTVGDMFLTEYQPVYFYKNSAWVVNTGSSGSNGNIDVLASAPPTPSSGRIYYNSVLNQIMVWNGTEWVGGGSTTNQYVTTVSSGQSLIIPASAHNCGMNPTVQVYYNGNQVGCTISIDGSGNVTVSWAITLQYDLKVVITGG